MKAKLYVILIVILIALAAFLVIYSQFQKDNSDLPYFEPQKENVDYKKSYLNEVDSQSTEFKALLKNSDYVSKSEEIKSQGQQKLNDLSETTIAQIHKKLKDIDKLSDAAGTTNNGTIYVLNGFEMLNDGKNPLESYPSFAIRYILYCYSKEIDRVYNNLSEHYSSRLPQEVIDCYTQFGIEVDYKIGCEIEDYYYYKVDYKWTKTDDGGWIVSVPDTITFSEEIPDGTTLDFLKTFHPIHTEYISEISQAFSSVYDKDSYKDYFTIREIYELTGVTTKDGGDSLINIYSGLTSNIEFGFENLNNYLSSIPQEYSDKIKTYADEIFKIREDYPKEVEAIIHQIEEQITHLQIEKLGRNPN